MIYKKVLTVKSKKSNKNRNNSNISGYFDKYEKMYDTGDFHSVTIILLAALILAVLWLANPAVVSELKIHVRCFEMVFSVPNFSNGASIDALLLFCLYSSTSYDASAYCFDCF